MNKNVFFNIIYKAVSVMMIVVISVSGLVGCGSKKTSSVTPGSSILPAPTKSITDAPVNAKTNEITIANFKREYLCITIGISMFTIGIYNWNL